MPIESSCQGCGKLLRVADEHAGKHARCPGCGHVYSVPTSTAASNAVPSAESSRELSSWNSPTAAVWHMKTPEGQIYGPVSREQLGQWAGEGRISGDCFVRQGERGSWQTADTIFPTLRTPRTRATAASTGGGYAARPRPHQHAVPYNPYAATPHYAQRGYATGYQEPHRGGMILTFALLGWFLCPIFAVVAWSMGAEDLRKIQLGRMDPSGQGLTQAGHILGMIQSILMLISFGGLFLLCLIGAATG
jgi:hypothetical protein